MKLYPFMRFLHVMFSCLRIGGLFSIFVIFLGAPDLNSLEWKIYTEAAVHIDHLLVPIGMVGVILTGIVMCMIKKTKFAWWLKVKVALTAMVIVLSFTSGLYIPSLLLLLGRPVDPVHLNYYSDLVVMGTNCLLFIIILLLSYLKPVSGLRPVQPARLPVPEER